MSNLLQACRFCRARLLQTKIAIWDDCRVRNLFLQTCVVHTGLGQGFLSKSGIKPVVKQANTTSQDDVNKGWKVIIYEAIMDKASWLVLVPHFNTTPHHTAVSRAHVAPIGVGIDEGGLHAVAKKIQQVKKDNEEFTKLV
ncbi:hypothetical protein AVEN_97938-1 [Araneus ventricosus]|uniref:Uncharacterized protein n=1 Tax=Araneus ventricosus TaxID=182803 RepID=A0A4Y2JXZ3_ARAVE|nr:hypothetical protein AVEN_97938-1 [Araneus ventricosus]